MNKIFFISIALISLSANADNSDCKNYLNEIVISSDEIRVSVEEIYPSLHGSDPFKIIETFKGVSSPCQFSYGYLKQNVIRSNPVALKSGKFYDNTPWIIFTYAEERPDPMSGIVATLVTYDQNGQQRSAYEVSYYLIWENAIARSSRIIDKKIASCTQDINYFSYNENGDINKELEFPDRHECECSFVIAE